MDKKPRRFPNSRAVKGMKRFRLLENSQLVLYHTALSMLTNYYFIFFLLRTFTRLRREKALAFGWRIKWIQIKVEQLSTFVSERSRLRHVASRTYGITFVPEVLRVTSPETNRNMQRERRGKTARRLRTSSKRDTIFRYTAFFVYGFPSFPSR